MENIQLIDNGMLEGLQLTAKKNERKRHNYDLRTSDRDSSQRMLNALKPGTKVPIHRHQHTSETVVCIHGCLDEVFYREVSLKEGQEPPHDGEVAYDETGFVEIARYRICPKEGVYGIQVPKMMWHSVEVKEDSTIFEAKDGAYRPHPHL